MKAGGEESTSVVVVVGGGCFGLLQAQAVKGGSSAAGVCVISQPANENI